MKRDAVFEDAWRAIRVGVVGDVMLDHYIFGDVERVSPEAPTPVVAFRGERFVPGGAGNAACNIAALGGAVSLVSVSGDDAGAGRLRAALEEHGIETAGVIADGRRPTIEKIRIVAMRQQMLRIDREEGGFLDARLTRRLLEHLRERMDGWDAILISDYAKGVISRVVVREMMKGAKQRRVPVVVNPKPLHVPWFAGAKALILNAREAGAALGHDVVSDADAEQAARTLARRCGSRILVTRGSEGMTFFDGRAVSHTRACKRGVADVTGAGDTVAAVMTLGAAARIPLARAALLANHAAAVVVEKPGTATVSVRELQEHLASHIVCHTKSGEQT